MKKLLLILALTGCATTTPPRQAPIPCLKCAEKETALASCEVDIRRLETAIHSYQKSLKIAIYAK